MKQSEKDNYGGTGRHRQTKGQTDKQRQGLTYKQREIQTNVGIDRQSLKGYTDI